METPGSSSSDRPLHWTVKSNYRLRTASFAIMFVAMALHGLDKSYGPVGWTLIALHLLVYPHVMYWLSLRAKTPQKAEVLNLNVDSFLFGLHVATQGFPIWFGFTVYIASTLNMTISHGRPGLIRSQTLFAAGALVSVVLLGWHFSPETGWPTTVVCVLGSAFYMMSIGMAAFGRNQQLRRTRETLRANEATLKHQLSEIQSLQTRLNIEMEARFAQRTKEQVNSQKLASLGAVVVGIAHEMNTPIGNTMLAASLLKDEVQGMKVAVQTGKLKRSDLDDALLRAEKATTLMLAGLERTADLIRSFKRVSVNRTEKDRKQFLVAALVGDVIATHGVAAQGKRIEFKASIAPDLRLDSYPDALHQALDIVVENARVHGLEGRSGTIHFFTAPCAPGRLKLCVSDDGAGIATEHLPKIFDPFFTTRLGMGGNGLGLSVAWNLVSGVLGGQITVTSELGVGTTFCLELPIEPIEGQT